MTNSIETILNLEEDSTENTLSKINVLEGELVTEGEEEGEEDNSTEYLEKEAIKQYDDIYQAAVETFNHQIDMLQNVEPKYSARLTEVANMLLNTALSASKLKYEVHNNKSKKVNITNNKITNNNNLITADRNEILKIIQNDE